MLSVPRLKKKGIVPFVLHRMPPEMAHLCAIHSYGEWVTATFSKLINMTKLSIQMKQWYVWATATRSILESTA